MGGDGGEGEEDAMGSRYYSVVKQIAFQSNVCVQLLCSHIILQCNEYDTPNGPMEWGRGAIILNFKHDKL